MLAIRTLAQSTQLSATGPAEQYPMPLRQGNNLSSGDVVIGQLGKERGGQTNVLDHERAILVGPQPVDTVDAIVLCQTQALALGPIGLASHDLFIPELPCNTPTIQSSDIAEADSERIRRLVVHERSASLPPGYQMLGFHQVERFAHGPGADAKLPRQFALIRDGPARLPLPGCDPLGECVAQLQIERSCQQFFSNS